MIIIIVTDSWCHNNTPNFLNYTHFSRVFSRTECLSGVGRRKDLD